MSRASHPVADARLSRLVPESLAFYARRGARRGPGSLEELLALRGAAAPPAPADPPAQVEVLQAGDGSVTARVHLPAGEAAGVVLDLPGGGFYLGSAAGRDLRNRALADALGVAVVSVEYRLAPEHPWPAAPDDCETAALWLAGHVEERFGTTSLAVCGFSAGSTLAMTTLLRLRRRGIPAFRAAVLEFGTYDLSGLTPAGQLIAGEYFLEAYLGGVADRSRPDISPIYAGPGLLEGLPPVLLVVGADDILLQDNLAMAEKLSAAGVEADLRVYPASPHGFTGHPTPMARAALDDIERWLGEHLRHSGRPEP